MTDDGDVTLRQALGARVRELRERNGERQDDVARRARDLGLAWNGSRVADLERGHKAIPVEELVLLPLLLASPDGIPSLLDLLPSGDRWVKLNGKARVRADALRRLASGHGDVVVRDIDAPKYNRPAVRATEHDLNRQASVWPGASLGELVQAELDATRAAEQSTARKYRVPAPVVSFTAWSRWGRGLTDERDARVADKAPPGAPARTLQALRGRVTRELRDELRPALDAYRNGA